MCRIQKQSLSYYDKVVVSDSRSKLRAINREINHTQGFDFHHDLEIY
jgi:hypothetical protein